ncbi:unnamed protein product [Gemmataceae bacterium]|nr:unnamed protein product [Gemmataceae bacterium]VTU02671.1 unnamed protein product [Gemmataceae bacterium]
MSGLFDRYFQLLAGRVPGAEYGVIASPDDESMLVEGPRAVPQGCLCQGA